MIMINTIDDIITKAMIQTETKIKKTGYTHPWSPSLVVAILTVPLWKVKLSTLHNGQDIQDVVNKILKSIKLFSG